MPIPRPSKQAIDNIVAAAMKKAKSDPKNKSRSAAEWREAESKLRADAERQGAAALKAAGDSLTKALKRLR